MDQGTASMVLAGLIAGLKLVGGSLADHTFLFLGAGEVRLKPFWHCCIYPVTLPLFITFIEKCDSFGFASPYGWKWIPIDQSTFEGIWQSL